MSSMKPVNRPVELRRRTEYPTHRAKARWRRSNRRRIAQRAQQERDRAANTN